MTRRLFYAIALNFAYCAAEAQYSGSKETFGQEGKKFSQGAGEKLYLLDKNAFSTDETNGFEGRVRIERDYPEGGYEITFKSYTAVCGGVETKPYVFLGDENTSKNDFMFTITAPDATPPPKTKKYVNLYWASCRGQFKKFK